MGPDLNFFPRLWGQSSLSFSGHEYRAPFECHESFENMTDEVLRTYSAIIVPSGIVADRLRYTEDVHNIPPATQFLARAFAEKNLLKGIICHGLWLVSSMSELVRGRSLTVHNNLIGDAKNYGATYVDQDLVIDEDLITARTGGHCHLLARAILDRMVG